jgi:hypothetical protein
MQCGACEDADAGPEPSCELGEDLLCLLELLRDEALMGMLSTGLLRERLSGDEGALVLLEELRDLCGDLLDVLQTDRVVPREDWRWGEAAEARQHKCPCLQLLAHSERAAQKLDVLFERLRVAEAREQQLAELDRVAKRRKSSAWENVPMNEDSLLGAVLASEAEQKAAEEAGEALDTARMAVFAALRREFSLVCEACASAFAGGSGAALSTKWLRRTPAPRTEAKEGARTQSRLAELALDSTKSSKLLPAQEVGLSCFCPCLLPSPLHALAAFHAFDAHIQECRKSIRCDSNVYGSIKSVLCAGFDQHHHHRYTGNEYRA